MALRIQTGDVPKGAVLLEEKDALDYQWKSIFQWKPLSEVWPFTIGLGTLGGCTALSSIYLNNYFRRRLNLGPYGRAASYVPNILVPSVLTAFVHQLTVTNKILLHKGDCPVCYEVRGAVIQVAIGLVYPMVLAPTAAFLMASLYGTYRMPSLTHDFKEVLKIYVKFTRRIKNVVVTIGALQTAVGLFMVHKEFKCLFKVEEKLLRLEKEVYGDRAD